MLLFMCGLYFYSNSISESLLDVNLSQKNIAPNRQYLFGTDWLGRSMFLRVIKGLGLSLKIGLVGAVLATGIAVLLSACSVVSQSFDRVIVYILDLTMSIPHMLLLIIISFLAGGDVKGVITALALTHWPSITRLLRSELMQIKNLEYIQISKNLGKGYLWQVAHHYLPLIMPQVLLSILLTFPHVLLHEASMTFLGFGLASNTPAIGTILSESMGHLLNGSWWLAFYPGLTLVSCVMIINLIGKRFSRMLFVKKED